MTISVLSKESQVPVFEKAFLNYPGFGSVTKQTVRGQIVGRWIADIEVKYAETVKYGTMPFLKAYTDLVRSAFFTSSSGMFDLFERKCGVGSTSLARHGARVETGDLLFITQNDSLDRVICPGIVRVYGDRISVDVNEFGNYWIKILGIPLVSILISLIPLLIFVKIFGDNIFVPWDVYNTWGVLACLNMIAYVVLVPLHRLLACKKSLRTELVEKRNKLVQNIYKLDSDPCWLSQTVKDYVMGATRYYTAMLVELEKMSKTLLGIPTQQLKSLLGESPKIDNLGCYEFGIKRGGVAIIIPGQVNEYYELIQQAERLNKKLFDEFAAFRVLLVALKFSLIELNDLGIKYQEISGVPIHLTPSTLVGKGDWRNQLNEEQERVSSQITRVLDEAGQTINLLQSMFCRIGSMLLPGTNPLRRDDVSALLKLSENSH